MLPLLLCSVLLAANPDVSFDSILVLPPSGPGMRAPFRPDPVLAQIASGEFHDPAAGDKVGTRAWETLTPNRDGTFAHPALMGGYAFASFNATEDSVMILEAGGHALVYFNGEPRAGDPYDNNMPRLPVKVHKGENTLLFVGGRGKLHAKLTPPSEPVFISPADATLPDLVEGQAEPALAGVVVVNASESWQKDVTILSSCAGSAEPVRSVVPPIPPLTMRKVPVTLVPAGAVKPGETQFELASAAGSAEAVRVPFKVRVRTASQTRAVTFKSAIDDSVQSFGFTPMAKTPTSPANEGRSPANPEGEVGGTGGHTHAPALFLSLHGADVDATHQAECYAPKDWGNLAAPTNRRRFGFDWEDWGRLDALEVLGIATAMTKPDPSRIYLTGHSMGGHGTWIIGSTYPDRFAAIAPSAGWTTFWSYSGADHFDKDPTPVERMFQRAMNVGDTIGLSHNLINEGVYVLHGDADETVPVEQARTMRKLLGEFHPDFAYHEQREVGHWWGNMCMDWPPLFDFLKAHRIPANDRVLSVDFTTANPAVSSTCHWAAIEQQQVQGEFSSVNFTWSPSSGTIRGTTKNVARLALRYDLLASMLDKQSEKLSGNLIEIDGVAVNMLEAPSQDFYHFVHTDTWLAAHKPLATEKNPQRSGPFKMAFNQKPVYVYGTKGTPEENAWALNKARYDAETIWYRGNGCFDIVADTDFKPQDFPDRDVIVLGNWVTNAAYRVLVSHSPLLVRPRVCAIMTSANPDSESPKDFEKSIRLFKGEDKVALFVRPRPDSSTALVGVIAPTGLAGARIADRLSYFTSGIAFPDWCVFDSEVLKSGTKAVLGAGYFGNAWEFDGGQAAWGVP
jgi:hypothetical protein